MIHYGTASDAMELQTLSERTRHGVERLRAHGILSCQQPDLSGISRKRLAAVLVLLYEKGGELRVLLTTRSKLLRAHPGQTALPGGKADETDADLVHTALREAHEEVGLPLGSTDVDTLCTLPLFLSQSQLLVTPVVALLTNPALLGLLTPCVDEVDRIFDHPLEAVLDPALAGREPLVPRGSEDWPYPEEFHNVTDQVIRVDETETVVYRHHRLRSCASAVKGLTADILICVAGIVYDRTTTYERHPPGRGVSYLLDLRINQYRTLEGSKAVERYIVHRGKGDTFDCSPPAAAPVSIPVAET